MTDRSDIERLLNQTGRTLNDLPERYPVDKIMAVGRLRGVNIKEAGKTILHQSDVIELLVSALKDALEKQPKWISVKERLPELPDRDYCYVIVNTFLKGNANSAPMEYERTIIRGKREERWRWISGNLAYTPDFWMPLPEPPEEEC